MMFGNNEPDQYRILRNTKTLEAYRARLRAADKAAMPFLVPPALSPFVWVLLMRLNSTPDQTGSLVKVAGAVVWFLVILGSIAYGLHRRHKYLRDHPFIDP